MHLVAKPNFIVLFLLEASCILVFLVHILFSRILKYFLIQGSVLSEGAKEIALCLSESGVTEQSIK